jgi:hypothetical protein
LAAQSNIGMYITEGWVLRAHYDTHSSSIAILFRIIVVDSFVMQYTFALIFAAALIACRYTHALDNPGPSIERLDRRTTYWPIKSGYVAFGDSYGAGLGTGATSTDACRVGSNNFGSLLNQWTNNPNVNYQQKVCSGDTTVGLNRQIDEWKWPSLADVVTGVQQSSLVLCHRSTG